MGKTQDPRGSDRKTVDPIALSETQQRLDAISREKAAEPRTPKEMARIFGEPSKAVIIDAKDTATRNLIESD